VARDNDLVSFYDEYELLELVRDDGVKTFQAREKATDRAVTIHLFSSPAAPYQAELLRKINKLPERESARITARGSHLGAIYLVTDNLADYGGLLEWITAASKAASRKPAPPPERLSDERPQNAELPLSAVTEPAGQLRLNKEFADLFATGQRPVFPSSRAVLPNAQTPAQSAAPTSAEPPAPASPAPRAAPKPTGADPNEITQPLRLQVPPKPAIADPDEATQTMRVPVGPKPTAFDPNESTQPLRVQPGSRAQAGTFVVHQPIVPAATQPFPVMAQPGLAAPPPIPPPLLTGKSKSSLVMIVAAIGIIGILTALFLLFLARRAHYL